MEAGLACQLREILTAQKKLSAGWPSAIELIAAEASWNAIHVSRTRVGFQETLDMGLLKEVDITVTHCPQWLAHSMRLLECWNAGMLAKGYREY